ncbi:MAG: ribosome-associated translation inhibitor RaiA [Chloroflexi bacterium]|nr:ribosome-associated translation inhibitor RaiA [Chloroflexota bacterium]
MTVEVAIYMHDVEIGQRLKDLIQKKVGRLDHYLPSITEARVDLTVEHNARSAEDRKVAQLTIRSRGAILRAEERTADIRSSIEAVVDKMQRQIERYKAKHYRGRGNGAGAEDLAGDMVVELEEDTPAPPIIARRKRHPLTPMNEAEAVDQMTMLSHENFFIFYNGETGSINVLYRRHDGSLGLIETEIA